MLVFLPINQIWALYMKMKTLSDSTRAFIIPKYIPVQDLTPNSNSFTDADIIFNILLTSFESIISLSNVSAENKNYCQANGKSTTRLNTVRIKFL